MKKLLLSCLLLAAAGGAYAQGSCSAATNITANGTFTTGAINGTHVATCFGSTTNSSGAAIKSRWWKFTPTSNGEITVTSDIAANPSGANGTDSRLSISKGTCGALTCVGYNDDVNGSTANANYRSTVTTPVAAGTTYYIQWDNYWAAVSFSFQFTFTATPCVRLGNFDFYLPDNYTTTDVSLFWKNAIGTPANYDIDWSADFTAAAGTGTIVTVPAGSTTYTQGDLTGLPESLNLRYYVRSNCGSSTSAWTGPRYIYLAVPLPYSNDFESPDNNYTDGFVGDFTLLQTDDTATPPIYADGDDGFLVYTTNSTTADSDDWGFSRALSLTAGEEVTFAFKTRAYSDTTPEEMAFDVTVGQTLDGTEHTVLGSFTESDDTQYTDRSVTFTAPDSGIYYFGIHNNTPTATGFTAMFVDTINITSVLSTNDFIASKLKVYPNPASNLVNISSEVNAIINTVEMSDLNGRVVKAMNVNSTNGQVSIADLATGVYMMKIKTDKGTAVKKIVKE